MWHQARRSAFVALSAGLWGCHASHLHTFAPGNPSATQAAIPHEHRAVPVIVEITEAEVMDSMRIQCTSGQPPPADVEQLRHRSALLGHLVLSRADACWDAYFRPPLQRRQELQSLCPYVVETQRARCDEGRPGACFRYATLLRDGECVAPDPDAARQLFEQVCHDLGGYYCLFVRPMLR